MATTANDAAPAAGKKTTATAAYKRWKTKLGKLAEGTPDYDAHMLVGHGKGLVTDFVASCARSLVVLDFCSPPQRKNEEASLAHSSTTRGVCARFQIYYNNEAKQGHHSWVCAPRRKNARADGFHATHRVGYSPPADSALGSIALGSFTVVLEVLAVFSEPWRLRFGPVGSFIISAANRTVRPVSVTRPLCTVMALPSLRRSVIISVVAVCSALMASR